MSLLARLNDFTAGTIIQSGQVDGEFNQIVALLNAASTTVSASIRSNLGSSIPVLQLQQLDVSGQLINCKDPSGNTVFRIDASGNVQIGTTVAGGGKSVTIIGDNPAFGLLDNDAEDWSIELNSNVASIILNGATYQEFRGGANDDVRFLRPVIIVPASTGVIPLVLDTPLTPGVNLAEFKNNGATQLIFKNNGQIVGIPKTVHTNTTATGNVGSGLDSLHSFNLPANSLASNGDYLLVDYAGFFAANDRNKQVALSFGGQGYEDGGAGIDLDGASNNGWRAIVRIMRVSDTTVRVSSGYIAQFGVFDSAGAVNTFATGGAFFTRNYTLTVSSLAANAQTMLVQGGATDGSPADNDVVQNLSIIQLCQIA